MILEFSEQNFTGKRSVEFIAESEEEDAFILNMLHSYSSGESVRFGFNSTEKELLLWVSPDQNAGQESH